MSATLTRPRQRSRTAALVGAGALGAIIGAAAGLLATPSTVLAISAIVTAGVATAVALVDAREHRIPDAATFPTGAFLLAYWCAAAAITANVTGILAALGAAAGALVFGWVFARFSTLGLGDVKLFCLLGLGFGAAGLGTVFLVFGTAFLGMCCVAVGMIASRKGTKETFLPFGPALAIGAIVGVTTVITQAQLL